MDGFDDLLAPSRNVLEANPFEDPFGKRSGSPDPWSTPFAAHEDTGGFGTNDDDGLNQGFGANDHDHDAGHSQGFATVDDEPFSSGQRQQPAYMVHDDEHNQRSPLQESHPQHVAPARSPTEETPPSPSDPLGIPASEEDDEDGQGQSGTRRGSPPSRNAGFLQDIPPEIQETQTIRPIITHSDDDHKSAIGGGFGSLDDDKIVLPSQNLARSISRSRQASPTVPSQPHPFDRPLSAAGLEDSLGGLTLGGGFGGESFGGGATPSWKPAPVAKDDDSDDDKPIGQTVAALVQQRSPPLTPQRKDVGAEPTFVISVDDPQKVGDPMRSFIMYTVHTRTTSTAFQKSAFSVLRRYSDFLWLYETLSLNNPGVIVPPVPEKNPFGRFDDTFVRQRRFALEKCIQKIANHPVLNKDDDFKMFLENDNFALEIKHRTSHKGIMATIGQTLAGPRFYETDEWFDRQKVYLDSLESQLRGLVKAIDFVAKQRQELALAIGEFSQSLSDLATSDVDKQLSSSLMGLAEVEKKAQEVADNQSQQDVITIMSTVDEYARLINSVRLAFNSRIRSYHGWRSADAEVGRVKQAHERNRAQGRIPPDRMGHSLAQIAEVERRALDAKHEFDHGSRLIKTEMARFEQERVEDFKDSLHAFLEGMISRQKELITKWEEYQQSLLKRVGKGQGPPTEQNDSTVSSPTSA